ncbi:MAG: TolC family protein [Cyclobacteriaceae bacterium]|nr:TolC family protein [Cyclobacteriaceae bacterium SS2]
MSKHVVSVWLILASFSVFSQEQLSISDAIAIGLEKNYDIRIVGKENLIAQNNNAWGEAGLLPTITLSATSNNNRRNQESDNQFFGGQLFPGFQLNDQRAYSVSPSAQVSWTLFQGNRAIINKRILEGIQAESAQNAEVVISNTIQAIILGYYFAVLEKERLDEFKKQLDLSSQKYEYVRAKYDLGSVVTGDVLLEENNYLTDSVNYINQVLVYRNSIRALNTLLASDDVNTDYTLTDSLVYEERVYDYNDLEMAMMDENIDLKRIYISQRILEEQVKQQRSSLFPALSMNAGYTWNRNVSDLTNAQYSGPNDSYQNPPEPLISKTGTYFANFTLAFNLYDGGRVNRAIKNAIIQQDMGEIQIDQMKTDLTQVLSQTYDEYNTRRNIYFIEHRKKMGAETNLRISEEKFKNGTINSFDYRTIQNNYLTAAIQELNALYLLVDSKVSLMRLTGGILSDNPTGG